MKLSLIGEVHIDELLGKTIRVGCRDLHLRAGQSPQTRSCHGTAGDGFLPYEAFSPLDIQQIIYAILTDEQIWQLEREGQIFFPDSVAYRALFDVHAVQSRAGVEVDFAAQD